MNQLELAALKSQQAKSDANARTRPRIRSTIRGRYRDNVAEYYRRLGEPND